MHSHMQQSHGARLHKLSWYCTVSNSTYKKAMQKLYIMHSWMRFATRKANAIFVCVVSFKIKVHSTVAVRFKLVRLATVTSRKVWWHAGWSPTFFLQMNGSWYMFIDILLLYKFDALLTQNGFRSNLRASYFNLGEHAPRPPSRYAYAC